MYMYRELRKMYYVLIVYKTEKRANIICCMVYDDSSKALTVKYELEEKKLGVCDIYPVPRLNSTNDIFLNHTDENVPSAHI
jgi:hypothetical protein